MMGHDRGTVPKFQCGDTHTMADSFLASSFLEASTGIVVKIYSTYLMLIDHSACAYLIRCTQQWQRRQQLTLVPAN